ncbi:MAG TPA: EF-P lysine aminoacylase EpmA [Kiloniellales bacterium]|nr:EF-P lysine aminoacylase EpmA [Kiloniellales bacterium]
MSWWQPDRYADRRPRLLLRQRLLVALRAWFQEQGFVEVETPILQLSPGMEPHIHAFPTRLEAPDGTGQPRFLHTSPEFACKKLLAAGEPRLFTLARVFRNGERSATHHPEFTMLEWYRAEADYTQLMADCEGLLSSIAANLWIPAYRWGGLSVPPTRPFERVTVREACRRWAGIDLFEHPTAEGLRLAVRTAGLRAAADDSWDDLVTRILIEKVEPELGRERPAFLLDYPISQAALARPKADEPRLAERFELYVAGLELANAFSELIDPVEQRRRFEADMDLKERLYKKRHPIDEDFLAALARMPPAAGIALGLDRLVMLATGASRIEEVLWAPVE